MLALIECSGLLFRLHYRIGRDSVDVSQVMHAFAAQLADIQEYVEGLAHGMGETSVTLVAVFDSEGNCRKERVESYKANRDAPASSMMTTLKAAPMQVSLLDGWQVVKAPHDWEADDVIATMAKQAAMRGERCQIHSVDKDFNQCLVDGIVGIAKPTGRQAATGMRYRPELYSYRSLVNDYGFGADRWVDCQCLVGDSADNIKGFPGVGYVKAREILQQYDGPLEQLPRELLTDNQWQAFNEQFLPNLDDYRFLLTLRTDLEI